MKTREKARPFMTRDYVIPVVGDGVTLGIGSDCYPGTIIAVTKNLKTVTIQMDSYTPAEGYDYFKNQVYTYTPNPSGNIEVWTLRNHGRYVAKGYKKGSGFYLSFNGRKAYSDPSF